MLMGTWILASVVLLTVALSITSVIDQHFILAAVILCGPPAFVLMLLADKV
jgi:hypothetical protein